MSKDKQGKDDFKLVYCSFCGKNQNEVRKLIAGPSVYVCDECVELCNDIIRDELLEDETSSSNSALPKPKEIRQELDNYVDIGASSKVCYQHNRMLDNHPRTQLCFILEQYGRVLINEPKRCRGMLKDLASHHTRETNLLITALEQKVAEELLKPNSLISVDMQIESLAKRLHDNLGTQLEFAFWAVESWALALNIIQEPVPKQNDS